jgi:lipopolysaccharide export system protein LptA
MMNKTFLITFCLIFLRILCIYGETWEFQGNDRLEYTGKDTQRTVLSGNAILSSETLSLRADKIEIVGENFDYAYCTGEVRVRDTEKDIFLRSDLLFYDRKMDYVRAEGNAVMEDYQNEVVAKGGIIETWNKEDLVTIQIGVRIAKEEMISRCEYARYDRSSNMVRLTGIPVVYKNDDVYEATTIRVNLENDEIILEGDVKGTFVSEEEKEDSETEEEIANPENTPESSEQEAGNER